MGAEPRVANVTVVGATLILRRFPLGRRLRNYAFDEQSGAGLTGNPPVGDLLVRVVAAPLLDHARDVGEPHAPQQPLLIKCEPTRTFLDTRKIRLDMGLASG
jgi:hypothetical protein